MPEVQPERILAALGVLGWPDDRERSAHVEPDGHEAAPPGHYWKTVTEVIEASDAAGATSIAERLRALEAEQLRLMADRGRLNLSAQAREHAIRARAYRLAVRVAEGREDTG
jgi:hypothetical protein